MLLKPYINEDGTEKNNFASRFRKAFNTAFEAVVEKYKKIVLLFIKRRWLGWSLLALSVVLLVFLMNTTKTGLVPDEDQGTLFVNVSTAPGSSLKTTNDIIDRVEKRLEDLPQKLHLQKVAGYGLLSGQGKFFRYDYREAENLGTSVRQRKTRCRQSSTRYTLARRILRMLQSLPLLRV